MKSVPPSLLLSSCIFSFVLLVYIVVLVLVFYFCPSSVRVVATFSGTVLFPLLFSVLPLFHLLTIGVEGYPCTWSNSDTHAQGRAPLCVRSAHLRSHYVHNTQRSRGANVHAPGVVRTRDPCKRAAADPRLIPRYHWDRFTIINFITLREWITCVWG